MRMITVSIKMPQEQYDHLVDVAHRAGISFGELMRALGQSDPGIDRLIGELIIREVQARVIPTFKSGITAAQKGVSDV